MRLADDERGRVPFALVGVLVLVGSATFAAGLGATGPTRTDRAADVAMDRVEGATTTALRAAVRDSAREAALRPVTRPANTTAGRVIDPETPFRDALRLRIYVRAREYLRATAHERGDVRASASLQATPNRSALAAALSRVRVAGAQNDTAVAVTIRNVSVTAERDGREVTHENRTYAVTVPTPVLAMHERTERFEAALNRGPVKGPGLGRQVTARLFGVALVRGGAQWAGVPVEQVLATRHVALTTNRAALAVQRRHFGHADPGTERAVRDASLRVAARDAAGMVPGGSDAMGAARGVAGATAVGPNESLEIDVGVAADRVYARVARRDATANRSIAGALRGAHRVEGRLRTVVDPIRVEERPDIGPPGANWERVSGRESVTETATPLGGPLPEARGEERVVRRFARRVDRVHTVRRTWQRGNRTKRAVERWTETYRVGVAVVAEYAPAERAPDRPTEPLFERGGALNGTNLKGTPASVERALVDDEGGPDAVAVDVAAGEARTRTFVHASRATNLSGWTRRDLQPLRKRLRNYSTNATGAALASMRTNPPAALASTIRADRERLVGAPQRYDGVADRARVAARATYLDAVLARLDARAAKVRAFETGYESVLAAEGIESPDSLATHAAAAGNATAADPYTIAGNLSNATLVPRGAPAYLGTGPVDHAAVRAVPRGRPYHPLATRNLNVFTVPYGDAATRAAAAATPEDRAASLATAGSTLAAANRTLAARPNATLRIRRDELAAEVRDAMVPVKRRAARTLGQETALPPSLRREAVAETGVRWSLGERAQAATNGSFAVAVADAAARQENLSARERRQLERRLDADVSEAVATSSVDPSLVRPVATRVRTLAHAALERQLTAAGERGTDRLRNRWYGEAMERLPDGLALLPPVTGWYATVNVWTVQTRGAYARFAVRTHRGLDGPSLRYVRDGSASLLDVDGDGDAERLGRSHRVTFSVATAVFVVVPPGPPGVGDGGVQNETSAGWPRPECTAPAGTECVE